MTIENSEISYSLADLYARAGMPNKRLAESKLVPMVLSKGEALA